MIKRTKGVIKSKRRKPKGNLKLRLLGFSKTKQLLIG